MDKEYYYLNGDTKTGPFSLDALKSAPINPDTLVWNSSLPDWVAARTLPELQDMFAVAEERSTSSNYDQKEPISMIQIFASGSSGILRINFPLPVTRKYSPASVPTSHPIGSHAPPVLKNAFTSSISSLFMR